MATKVIVRWNPTHPVHGRREISAEDFRREGIFTQQTNLAWDRSTGMWLAADEAQISAEALAWLEQQGGEFTVERQEVPDEEPEAPSEDNPPPSLNDPADAAEGESTSGSRSTAGRATTTSSRA